MGMIIKKNRKLNYIIQVKILKKKEKKNYIIEKILILIIHLLDKINEELGKSINDNIMMPEKDLENFPEIDDNKISHKLKEEMLNNALDDSINK